MEEIKLFSLYLLFGCLVKALHASVTLGELQDKDIKP